MAAQCEAHSVTNCMIIFDENYVSFFAFKKCEVLSDFVEGKTLAAKGVGHNPAHKRLCKTPIGVVPWPSGATCSQVDQGGETQITPKMKLQK